MKKVLGLALTVFSLTVAGCGGGGEETPPQTPEEVQQGHAQMHDAMKEQQKKMGGRR